MQNKRNDKIIKKRTDAREGVDLKIYTIPYEQSRPAKNANNKKTKHKAAMQIGPKDHNCRQQKPSRSLQAFSVENYAKQHSRSVRRSGEINIWGRRKRGVKQRRGEYGYTNCGC